MPVQKLAPQVKSYISAFDVTAISVSTTGRLPYCRAIHRAVNADIASSRVAASPQSAAECAYVGHWMSD